MAVFETSKFYEKRSPMNSFRPTIPFGKQKSIKMDSYKIFVEKKTSLRTKILTILRKSEQQGCLLETGTLYVPIVS